ncbi:ferrous iron transport protein A [Streptomyces olivoreticuli]
MTINSHPHQPGSREVEAAELGPELPPGDEWPRGSMSPGIHVTVIQDVSWDGPWQVEFQATIDDLYPPEPARGSGAREGELSYWVVFDEPQYNSDGEGPFRGAQIWDRYLKPNPEA